MTTPNAEARPHVWSVVYRNHGGMSEQWTYSETNALDHQKHGAIITPLYTATDYDALRAEVERLRADNEMYLKYVDTEVDFEIAATAEEWKDRAEAAEARASWLEENLRSTLILLKCDDEFIDKQINPPHLNAQGESNG